MGEIGMAAANVKISHDKRLNLRCFLNLIDEAVVSKVDILVLPEVGLQGYIDTAFRLGSDGCAEQRRYYHIEAETIPGPSTDVIAEVCARTGIHVQLGLAERCFHGNAIYNSVALIGPEGVVGVYRKIHNHFEYPYFAMGEETPVFASAIGSMASIICYDLCFPELIRSYALRGADIILMSTAWPMQGADRSSDFYGWAMDASARSNAFFNQCWMIISNHCEIGAYSRGVNYYGSSKIIDPLGNVVACIEEGEGLAVHFADVSMEVLKARTRGFFGVNLLQDRRPEHYSILARDDYRYPSRQSQPSH